MGEKRSLWVTRYPINNIPAYRCPRCESGILQLEEKSVIQFRTGNARAHFAAENYYDPTNDEGRFIFMLLCSRKVCQEPVGVIGNTSEHPYFGVDGEVEYETYFEPTAIVPGPPLADIPEKTPELVAETLRQGFTLFWADLGASANRLRIAAERLMDAQKVKRTSINKSGKRTRLTLATRIEIYGKENPDHKGFLDALRWVGNEASHEGVVSRDDLLTGYELMQEGLRDLYGKNYRLQLAKRGREIVARKGKPKRIKSLL